MHKGGGVHHSKFDTTAMSVMRVLRVYRQKLPIAVNCLCCPVSWTSPSTDSPIFEPPLEFLLTIIEYCQGCHVTSAGNDNVCLLKLEVLPVCHSTNIESNHYAYLQTKRFTTTVYIANTWEVWLGASWLGASYF